MTVGPYYAQDSMYYRTQDKLVEQFNEMMSEELGEPFKLPTHKEVCPTCHGDSVITNRSIDGNGLSDEMMDDPDFMEGYISGHYNVTCDECNGVNVVDVVDEESIPGSVLQQWHEYLKDYQECLSENLGEMRMGA